MPPIQLNRRRFLGCSAAAGWAITQTRGAEGEEIVDPRPLRIGVIGLGNRGTTLLRAALADPTIEIAALADPEPKHLARAGGIVEKARGRRPDGFDSSLRLLERDDLAAVIVALPCDLHARVYQQSLEAGKHLYAEKPLGLDPAECDRLIVEAGRRPDQVVHVGFQRRSNPRYREAIAAIHRGELGPLLSGTAAWVSSNGPIRGHDGWLSRRERSGDWMVEQAVHVWDVFHWIARGVPVEAYASGRRDVFRESDPDRDVTDDYQVQLRWADGFSASFAQSWAAPADDAFTGVSLRVTGREAGLDFATGSLTPRDRKRPRQSFHPAIAADTDAALGAFLEAARRPRSDRPDPPVSLQAARDATITGLMVRLAVDEARVARRDEVDPRPVA